MKQAELPKILAQFKNAEQVDNFLVALLTPSEREEFERRIQIFRMLIAGVPQRTIAEKLGVSLATISRGSRELKYGSVPLSDILQ